MCVRKAKEIHLLQLPFKHKMFLVGIVVYPGVSWIICHNEHIYSNKIRNTNANETGNVPYAGLLCFRTWASCVIRARKGRNPNTSFCRNTFVCFILYICNSHQILQISTLTRINMKRVFWIERGRRWNLEFMPQSFCLRGDFVIGSSIETTPVRLKIFENIQNKKC